MMDFDESMTKAIREAVLHINGLTSRPFHEKADRIERVQLFVTSLRREIRSVSRLYGDWKNILLTKGIWFDAGVLEEESVLAAYRVLDKLKRTRLESWLRSIEPVTIEDESKDIQNELDACRAELRGLDLIITDGKQIVAKSDKLVDEVVKFLEPEPVD